jgi:hypothetical protein
VPSEVWIISELGDKSSRAIARLRCRVTSLTYHPANRDHNLLRKLGSPINPGKGESMKTATLGRDAVMMLSHRFVRLIEDHSDALASSLMHKVQRSSHTEAYHKIPSEELTQRVYEIYRHLGEWLLDKSEADIEERYTQIGICRSQQGVPLSQVIWAITLTKNNLWEFTLDESYPDRPVEIFGKQELLQLLEQFFDRAIYSTAVGYEWAAEKQAKNESKSRKTG